jgi:hypothetical protein
MAVRSDLRVGCALPLGKFLVFYMAAGRIRYIEKSNYLRIQARLVNILIITVNIKLLYLNNKLTVKST